MLGLPLVAWLLSGGAVLEPGLPPRVEQASLSQGDWVGELRRGETAHFVRLRFLGDTTGAESFVDLPEDDAWDVGASLRVMPNGRLEIAFPVNGDTLQLGGTVKDDVIDARGELAGAAASLHAIRRIAYDPALVRPLAGNYAISDDRVVSMGPMDEAGGWLSFFDSGTLRGGILYALSDSVFFTGPARGIDYPIDIRATVQRVPDGRIHALRWEEQGRGTQLARRLDDVAQEDVAFHNGDVRLVGNVTLPKSPGPHPAVVLIHGCCGTVPTRDFGYWSSYLAHHGFAVLAFDRRGGGESTGNATASYEELAGDVLAGVRLLLARPDIDPRHVGLFGMSNGGYVAPLAAVRSHGQVAFVAVRAGSARRVGGNIDFEVGNDLRARGFDERAVEQAVAVRRRVTDFVVERPEISPAMWDSLQQEVEAVADEPWFGWSRTAWVPMVSVSDSGGRAYLATLRSAWEYDPMPYWRQVRVPVYVMLGEHDRSVPSEETAAALRSAFSSVHHPDATVRLFPDGDHGLVAVGDGSGAWKAMQYVPDFQAGLVRWLRAHVDESP
jgi:dienelactone hydrolase